VTEQDAAAELERLDRENGPMTESEQKHFENVLWLRAMVLGWTGDPLEQPATSVLATYRQMRTERAGK
jgi:hypothetical protein